MTALREKLEAIRLKAGPLMNLGDVSEKTVPKMTMVSPPQNGGAISTRTFIPHRCHASIGVLGAVSVATACMLPGTPGASQAAIPDGQCKTLNVEHPIGAMSVVVDMDDEGAVENAAILRTARKLFDGTVFAP
jgi:4-oxalomesaconate tautomerase